MQRGAPLGHHLEATVRLASVCVCVCGRKIELIKGLPPAPPSRPGQWLFSGGPELVRLPSLAGGEGAGSPPTGASGVGAAGPLRTVIAYQDG